MGCNRTSTQRLVEYAPVSIFGAYIVYQKKAVLHYLASTFGVRKATKMLFLADYLQRWGKYLLRGNSKKKPYCALFQSAKVSNFLQKMLRTSLIKLYDNFMNLPKSIFLKPISFVKKVM